MCFRVYMNAHSSRKTLTRETPADILKSNLHGSLFTFISKVKKKENYSDGLSAEKVVHVVQFVEAKSV